MTYIALKVLLNASQPGGSGALMCPESFVDSGTV